MTDNVANDRLSVALSPAIQKARDASLGLHSVRLTCPSGKSRPFPKIRQSLASKIIRFTRNTNHPYPPPRPAPAGGAYRDRHGRGVGGCDGRTGASGERGGYGRRRRVVLVPRCWHQAGGDEPSGDGGYQARHSGESAR